METFKSILDFETLCKISNYGRILSTKTKKFRKQHIAPDGYKRVVLCENKVFKMSSVHVLVAKTFLKYSKNEKK